MEIRLKLDHTDPHSLAFEVEVDGRAAVFKLDARMLGLQLARGRPPVNATEIVLAELAPIIDALQRRVAA